MATGKPPRRPKAQSEPVTIDLQAEHSDAVAPDEGLRPDELHADESTSAAPEGSPVELAKEETPDKTKDPEETVAAEESTPKSASTSRTSSTSALLAAGIAGGLVSLALAGSMHYAGFLPSVSSTPAQSIPPELSERLSAIESRVASLSQSAASQAADEGLGPRIGALESAIEEIRQQASSSPNESDLAGLRGEFAALGESLGQLKAEVDSNRQSVEATDARLAEAERKIDEPRTDVEMARAIAATALKAAVDRGGPFLAELETLAGVAADDPAIEELRSYAATGVPSRAELVRRFPDVATAILTAIHQPEEADGIGARLLSSAFSVIKVRPVGNIEGETPEAIVARMEDKLRNGDFKGAALEWDSLPEPGKAASNDFAQLLKNRVTIETLAGSVMSNAVDKNG